MCGRLALFKWCSMPRDGWLSWTVFSCSISLYHTLLRMRSQIGESIEESHRKIDVGTHSNQSVIKGYKLQSISRLHYSHQNQQVFIRASWRHTDRVTRCSTQTPAVEALHWMVLLLCSILLKIWEQAWNWIIDYNL